MPKTFSPGWTTNRGRWAFTWPLWLSRREGLLSRLVPPTGAGKVSFFFLMRGGGFVAGWVFLLWFGLRMGGGVFFFFLWGGGGGGGLGGFAEVNLGVSYIVLAS